MIYKGLQHSSVQNIIRLPGIGQNSHQLNKPHYDVGSLAFLIAQVTCGWLLLSTSDFLILLSGCQDPIPLAFLEHQRGTNLSALSPFIPKVNAFLHIGPFQHTLVAWKQHRGWPYNLSFLMPSCLQGAPRLAGPHTCFHVLPLF